MGGGDAGKTAEAGHINPRIRVHQPHLIIVQVPRNATVLPRPRWALCHM
jgi:hypothetical protein